MHGAHEVPGSGFRDQTALPRTPLLIVGFGPTVQNNPPPTHTHIHTQTRAPSLRSQPSFPSSFPSPITPAKLPARYTSSWKAALKCSTYTWK